MPESDWPDLWLNPDADSLLGEEFRIQCARVTRKCGSLADRYCGAFFSRPADEIANLLREVAELRSKAACLDGQQAARQAGDQADSQLHDSQLVVDDVSAAVDELLQLVEQEWRALAEEKAHALLADPALRPYRHYLASAWALASYTLEEQAERAVAARDSTAEWAWVNLYHRIMTSLRPVVNGTPLSIERARNALELEEATLRMRSLEAIYDALEPMADVLAHCLDSLVADRLAMSELRGLPYARAERDLTNELPAAVVDNMLTVAEQYYHLPRRWFVRKASLMGISRLKFADTRAPIGRYPYIPYASATQVVAEALTRFTPAAGRLVREMTARGLVDAEAREAKQRGSFCWSLGPRKPPRIMLSYLGTIEDVISLAHEFGHALHFTLAGHEQNGLTFDAPLALNEVAPAFTELLVIDWLIENEPSEANRLVLAAKRADSAIDAIFGSVFLTQMETRAHEIRAAGSILTNDRIQQLWSECGGKLYGPDVELPSRWGLHWALVPHLVHERFYSYIYAFARLIGLILYATYKQEPDLVRPKILNLLRFGSSADPARQLAVADIDLADPNIWHKGFAFFEESLDPLWYQTG